MTSTTPTVGTTGLFGDASLDTSRFSYALDELCQRVPGVLAAVVVSGDGLLLAANTTLEKDDGDQIAALVSGAIGLSRGFGQLIQAGNIGVHLRQDDTVELDYLLVAFTHANWLVMTAGDTLLLAAAVLFDSNTAAVANELDTLGKRFVGHLTQARSGASGT
ncbi:roadblock/LC7 domain-containing protein [Dactylosporangium salmoneum]|uniref:Roadblock/LC7 domain-containing protein n=1 Tax=Dactylosporangium salmoneum TaxID=53361 RepID=A0ABN3GHB3_9ACTN